MTASATAAALILLLAPSTAVHAQPSSAASDLEVLVAVHNVLHIADMITTSYALSAAQPATELNPVLRPFSRSPAALSLVSGAMSVTEVWALSRLRARHPRLATGIAAALVATEVWALGHNIRTAGRIQAARSGWRPPLPQ